MRIASLVLTVAMFALATIQAAQKDTPGPSFKDTESLLKSLPAVTLPALDETHALWLSAMPLSCLDRPHARPANPPYLWQPAYAPLENFDKSRVFYGCFDWHSAVNSTWALVKILKMFPDLPTGQLVRRKLTAHLGKSNIEGELGFFKDAGPFELPYGYAWVLKVQGELLSWKDPDAEKWAANLAPLVKLYSERLVQHLKNPEPNRTGVHPNAALAMNLLLDYTSIAKDEALKAAVVEAAMRYYSKDTKCKTAEEPGPTDFISPCLTEASIMGRLLDQPAFVAWFDTFLPPLHSPEFRPLTQPLDPEFITKPERVAAKSHMIGLAFMRAEEMNRVAAALPRGDQRAAALRKLSAMHADMGLRAEAAAGYVGSHFLGAFTLLYLLSIATTT